MDKRQVRFGEARLDPQAVSTLDAATRARLRAALRIILDDAAADAVAGHAFRHSQGIDIYKAVWSGARRRLLTARLRARAGRSRAVNVDRPFADPASTPAQPATALALHLGLGLDGDQLEQIFGRDADDIGAEMLSARRVIDPACPRPCRRFAPAIGRYRDPSLDHGDRLGLLGHANGCDACRRTLEFVRSLDADLIGEIDRIEAALSPLPAPSASRRVARAIALAGAVGVMALAIAGLAALLNRLTAGDAPPAPLTVGAQSALSGWLLSVGSTGQIEAYDLSSGASVILRDEGTQTGVSASLSPGGDIIAVWNPGYASMGGRGSIEFITVRGETLATYPWDTTDWFTYPGGWLDARTLLAVAYPAYPPDMDQDAFEELARTSSRLLAVSARDGSARELLVGDVGAAVASPDGRMVAVVSSYAMDRLGQDLTLYPYHAGTLGTPVAALAGSVRSQPIWLPDSSAVVVSRITATARAQLEQTAGGRNGSRPVEVELVSLAAGGQLRELLPGISYHDAYPIVAGPDARPLVFTARSSPSSPPDETWLVRPDGTRQAFMPERASIIYGSPVWSPDNAQFLVLVGIEAYAGEERAWGGIGSSALVAVLPDGSWRIIRTIFSSSPGFVFAWVPEAAISAPQPGNAALAGEAYALEPVAGIEPGDLLAAPAASLHHTHIIITDGDLNVPMIWNRGQSSARRLGSDVEQLRWTGDGRELLGIQRGSSSGSVGSRLVYVPEPLAIQPWSGQPASVAFDPALLGGEQTRRYAAPLLAPDGNHLAFFILNPETKIAELWLAGWEREAAPLARWKLADDSLLDLEVVASWVDRATLVFAQPSNWRDGLPRSIELMRVVITDPANPRVERVTTMRARGAERGIAMREIVVSPDGAEVAWRIRHFHQHATDRGRVDSIEVAGVHDVNQRIEITRAHPGNGLGWSPDGRWLVAGLDRRVALLARDGLTTAYVTPEDMPADTPVWVGQDEIWFNLGGDDGYRVWRVRIA